MRKVLGSAPWGSSKLLRVEVSCVRLFLGCGQVLVFGGRRPQNFKCSSKGLDKSWMSDGYCGGMHLLSDGRVFRDMLQIDTVGLIVRRKSQGLDGLAAGAAGHNPRCVVQVY